MRGTLLYPLLVALITIGMIPAVPAEGTNKPVGRGASLLMTNCARCHAVGRTGASPHPSAPPFPTLSHRFKIEGLAEALAEGLSTIMVHVDIERDCESRVQLARTPLLGPDCRRRCWRRSEFPTEPWSWALLCSPLGGFDAHAWHDAYLP